MTTDQAFILAAGLGNRMRPLTDERPKPLVLVKGKPIIDYALESLAAADIKRVVVNTHYKAELLQDHVISGSWPFEVVISHEARLLDTGGGLKQGLQYLDANKPVLALSGDSILLGENSLPQLLSAWNDDTDILLLLQSLKTMVLTPGIGDYDIIHGKPVRSKNQSGQYMWTSARVFHPRIFKNAPDGVFSFLPLMDRCEKEGRLSAQTHQGVWHHLTTPADVARVDAA